MTERNHVFGAGECWCGYSREHYQQGGPNHLEAAAMEPCEVCGRPDDAHTFAELLVCLYGEAGLTREQAEGIIDRLTEEVVE